MVAVFHTHKPPLYPTLTHKIAQGIKTNSTKTPNKITYNQMNINELQIQKKLEKLNKNQLISNIKDIIAKHGEFNTSMVEAEYSPSVPKQRGHLTHLIEDFNVNDVGVDVWDNGGGNVVDSYIMQYNELDKTTLQYILELAIKYSEDICSFS